MTVSTSARHRCPKSGRLRLCSRHSKVSACPAPAARAASVHAGGGAAAGQLAASWRTARPQLLQPCLPAPVCGPASAAAGAIPADTRAIAPRRRRGQRASSRDPAAADAAADGTSGGGGGGGGHQGLPARRSPASRPCTHAAARWTAGCPAHSPPPGGTAPTGTRRTPARPGASAPPPPRPPPLSMGEPEPEQKCDVRRQASRPAARHLAPGTPTCSSAAALRSLHGSLPPSPGDVDFIHTRSASGQGDENGGVQLPAWFDHTPEELGETGLPCTAGAGGCLRATRGLGCPGRASWVAGEACSDAQETPGLLPLLGRGLMVHLARRRAIHTAVSTHGSRNLRPLVLEI